MIEAVIFDLDGTLVDSVDEHASAWKDAFAYFNKDISFQDIREQIGKGGDEILPTFLKPAEIKAFGEELKQYRADHFQKHYIHRIKPFPSTRELFEKIKGDRKKIAIGSSAHSEEIQHYLKVAAIADLIDAETSADDVEKSKPHPDIFQIVLAKLQLRGRQAIVIGDSPYDMDAAGRAGIATIGFLSGGFSRQSLLDAGCLAIYGGPSDLLVNYQQSPIVQR